MFNIFAYAASYVGNPLDDASTVSILERFFSSLSVVAMPFIVILLLILGFLFVSALGRKQSLQSNAQYMKYIAIIVGILIALPLIFKIFLNFIFDLYNTIVN